MYILKVMMKFSRICLAVFSLILLVCNSASADNIVKSSQISLNYLGHDAGAADNSYGKRTKRALEQFYRDMGGDFDGELDIIELLQLQKRIVESDKTSATFGNNGSWHYIFPDRNNNAFQLLCKRPGNFLTCDSTNWRKRLSSQIVFVSASPTETDTIEDYYQVTTLEGKTFFARSFYSGRKNGGSFMFG